MGAYEDYLNSLEGKEGLVLDDVIKELTKHHSDDVGSLTAMISEKDSAIAERDTTIAGNTEEITRWKAKNADLYMQLPGEHQPNSNVPPEKEELTLENVTIDDLFQKG